MVAEQRETDAGYIFYINKKTGEQQNDHPKLLEVMKMIHDQHKFIKYVTYRCATKIWLLKQSFYSKYPVPRRTCFLLPCPQSTFSSFSCQHSVQFCDVSAEPFRPEPVRQCAIAQTIATHVAFARHLFRCREMWTFRTM